MGTIAENTGAAKADNLQGQATAQMKKIKGSLAAAEYSSRKRQNRWNGGARTQGDAMHVWAGVGVWNRDREKGRERVRTSTS